MYQLGQDTLGYAVITIYQNFSSLTLKFISYLCKLCCRSPWFFRAYILHVVPKYPRMPLFYGTSISTWCFRVHFGRWRDHDTLALKYVTVILSHSQLTRISHVVPPYLWGWEILFSVCLGKQREVEIMVSINDVYLEYKEFGDSTPRTWVK